MTTKLFGFLAAAGIAVGLTALPASASEYGKTINSSCIGLNYGELVSTARQAGHISGGVSGAKSFVDSGLLAAHESLICP